VTGIGRLAGGAAAVLLLVLGAGVFLFQYTYSSDRMTAVQQAMGMETAPPEHHVVPEGFQGWAVVSYGVEATPPLTETDGVVVLVYPANGHLDTVTPAPTAGGFHHRSYFEQRREGRVPLSRLGKIWGEYTMRTADDASGTGMRHSAGFFVGTYEAFKSTPRPLPHDIESIRRITEQGD
jgi:hypothetical protein